MQLSRAQSTIELLCIMQAFSVVRPIAVPRAKEHLSLILFFQEEQRDKWAPISLFRTGVISSRT